MRFFKIALVSLLLSAVVCLSSAGAQAPQRSAAPARGNAASTAPVATLGQLMKGILYPNSNVIFYVQDKDPTKVKPAPDPSLSTDPLASTYGGWEAVENSALALYEAANLLGSRTQVYKALKTMDPESTPGHPKIPDEIIH